MLNGPVYLFSSFSLLRNTERVDPFAINIKLRKETLRNLLEMVKGKE